MAFEKAILRVLGLLTDPSQARPESLDSGANARLDDMQKLLKSRNVVGVGISEKTVGGKTTKKLALTFYVERKKPLSSLRGDSAIPPSVPESLGGAAAIPTDVVAIGRLRPDKVPLKTRRPVQPGYSIGSLVKGSTGTLGAIVSRGGKIYLLSNSHVLAKSGKGKKGDAILFPGPDDGGKKPADIVAKLVDFKKFKTGGSYVNHVDCALAIPVASRAKDIQSDIKGIGLPRGTVPPRRGMRIVKCGRTTGKTSGRVKDVHFRFTLPYDVGNVGYIDQVLCTRYSKPGDSGSLVLESKSKKVVGLHFASSRGGSVFCPIGDVLKTLRVSLVTTPIP